MTDYGEGKIVEEIILVNTKTLSFFNLIYNNENEYKKKLENIKIILSKIPEF